MRYALIALGSVVLLAAVMLGCYWLLMQGVITPQGVRAPVGKFVGVGLLATVLGAVLCSGQCGRSKRRGFTLIELLVTITIIGIVAAISLGALQATRRYAAVQKTRATIAKLDAIILRRMEEFSNRRIQIHENYMQSRLHFYQPNPNIPPTPAQQHAAFKDFQWAKLSMKRDMMRMELPDCKWDVENGPQALATYDAVFVNGKWVTPQDVLIREPARHKVYARNPPWAEPGQDSFESAQCLYLIVSSVPSDLEQFNESEFGVVGPNKRVFIDGWGKPIMFLRWAPGYRSDIQSGDAVGDHDPFDNRNIDAAQFKLTPLIYSAGPDREYGIWLGDVTNGSPVPSPDTSGHIRPLDSHNAAGTALNHLLGDPRPDVPYDPIMNPNYIREDLLWLDNITNHQIETQ